MKIHNLLRRRVIVGVAGALFLATSGFAQEIENKEWPEAPGATQPWGTAQAQSASPDAKAASNGTNGPIGPIGVDASTLLASSASAGVPATIAKPIVVSEAVISQSRTVGTWAIAGLLIFFTVIALYRRNRVRRSDQASDVEVR
jgi:hypothetical protein